MFRALSHTATICRTYGSPCLDKSAFLGDYDNAKISESAIKSLSSALV
jgi:hypothetical protein